MASAIQFIFFKQVFGRLMGNINKVLNVKR